MSENLEKKEYRVLARKYRPQKFNDLVGQEILVRSLINSIINNRIAHAYLLTGVRGIGKTTTARLMAMSLNCENRSKDNCEPCGNCGSCVSIREDRNLDVIEMDAASKTGVDDIREIIENVKYKALNSQYKIFIIDEVHMLSKNAFNALLKTLEEPPSHVKFIFATTEVKKIPITIISRCQRFDLQRIDKEILSKYLLLIAEKEKLQISKDAIFLIVRVADGSVRDALSLLDQAISNETQNISLESIAKMLGLADRANIFDLLNSIFLGDAPKALEIFNNIYKSGADVLMVFNEMLNVVHFITQIKILPDLKDDLHIPELERERGFEMSEKISMLSLGRVWQVLFKGYEELQSGFYLLQHGEMIIIRLIYLYEGPSPDDLLKKNSFKNLENKNILSKEIKDNDIVNKEEVDLENLSKINDNHTKNNKNNKLGLEVKSFRDFVNLFYQKKEAMLHTYLYNNAKLISFEEGKILINVNTITDPHFNRTIAKLVSTWTGRIWQISSSSSNIGKTLYEEDLIIQQKEIENMKSKPDIKVILDSFTHAKIHSITNISETFQEEKFIIETSKIKEE